MICLLGYCKKAVTDLSRHLKTVHKWTKEKERGAMAQYALRKEYVLSKIPSKIGKTAKQEGGLNNTKLPVDYHKYRLCPVSFCESIVIRFDQHLQQQHNISSKTELFRFYLKNAIHTKVGAGSLLKPISSSSCSVQKRLLSDSNGAYDEHDVYSEPVSSSSEGEKNSDFDEGDPTYDPTESKDVVDASTIQLIGEFYANLISPNGGK